MAGMKQPRAPSPRIATTAIAIAALSIDLAGASAPVDFRIIPAGEFRSWDGRPSEVPAWICTEEDGRRVVAKLSARTRKSVIDYEHATLKVKTKPGKAPAAGWFDKAEWRPDGVWLIGVDWTALAAQEIADKSYRYVSPVLAYDKTTGHIESLLYAALTNDPGIDDLTDLAALAAEVFLDQPTQEDVQMDLLKKLLAALGLQESATETEALSAVAALKTNVASLSAQVDAPDPKKFVAVAALTALQTDFAALQGKYDALQVEVAGDKVEKLIAKGKADRKISPAIESWARDLGKSDLAALSAYLEKAPPVVPDGTQTGGKGGDGLAALSADQQKVCDMLGLDPEAYRQTLSAQA